MERQQGREGRQGRRQESLNDPGDGDPGGHAGDGIQPGQEERVTWSPERGQITVQRDFVGRQVDVVEPLKIRLQEDDVPTLIPAVALSRGNGTGEHVLLIHVIQANRGAQVGHRQGQSRRQCQEEYGAQGPPAEPGLLPSTGYPLPHFGGSAWAPSKNSSIRWNKSSRSWPRVSPIWPIRKVLPFRGP